MPLVFARQSTKASLGVEADAQSPSTPDFFLFNLLEFDIYPGPAEGVLQSQSPSSFSLTTALTYEQVAFWKWNNDNPYKFQQI